MKRNFLTGVAILFPIILTYLVVHFFVNLLTVPFLGLLKYILPNEPPEFSLFFSKLLILLALGILFCLVGMLGRIFLGNYFFQSVDAIARRIPIINRIYTILHDSIQTLFNGTGAKFSQVVLVPFPNEKSYSIGFIANEELPKSSNISIGQLVTVFVPGAPVPTIGYILHYPRDQVFPLNLTVNEGIKFILSCGAIAKEVTLSRQKD